MQNYAILWWFLARRCTREYRIACLFDSLCKIVNWEPAYQICYCLLSSRQQSKMWNSCCNARPQTSSLQSPDLCLLTVLTLILWITGYVEYCSNVFIGYLLKTERWWTEVASDWAWLGIQQSIADQTIDQWRVHLNACVKAKEKHFENMLWCAVLQVSMIFMKLTISYFFCFATFNQSWLLSFNSGCWTTFGTFIEFRTVKILGQQIWNFYTVLLQIHSGNRLQKISSLDLSLIKLLQNEQGCNFLPHSVDR